MTVQGHSPTHPVLLGFWDRSPQLAYLHNRAESLLVSPWALLVTTMANAVSHIPPSVRSPDGGTMNFLVGITGRPGSGFTTTLRAAEETIGALGKISGVPPLKFCLEELWSGGQRYDFPSASLNLDNALGLSQLFYKQGREARKRTLDMLDGKRLPLPNGQVFEEDAYRVTLRESLYPGYNASWLFQDRQREDGIPERYLIAPLWRTHPTAVSLSPVAPALPDWSRVPDGAVRAASGFVDDDDPLLPMRNRVAVALASLHGRTAVNELDWELSLAPVLVSEQVSAEMARAAETRSS